MEVKERQYILKPVVKNRFSGVSSYSKSSFSVEGAQLGKSGYKTGLTKDEEKEFEKALGLKEGALNKSFTINSEGRPDSYWGTVLNMSIPRDRPYFLNVNSPLDELKFKVLCQRDDIAMSEIELAKKPFALFYIVDEEAKAKQTEQKMNKEFEAMELLMESTAEEKKGFARLYGKNGVNELSEKVIKTYLYDKIKESPDMFLSMTKDNPDMETKILIAEMLENGILKKKGSFYNYQDEVIGNSLDAVISFLKDPKNQSVKITAKQIVKNVKKENK